MMVRTGSLLISRFPAAASYRESSRALKRRSRSSVTVIVSNRPAGKPIRGGSRGALENSNCVHLEDDSMWGCLTTAWRCLYFQSVKAASAWFIYGGRRCTEEDPFADPCALPESSTKLISKLDTLNAQRGQEDEDVASFSKFGQNNTYAASSPKQFLI